jgi:hypothetical protein
MSFDRRTMMISTLGGALAGPALAQTLRKLDAPTASRLARLGLSHVTRQYPVQPGGIRSRPDEPRDQKVNRPVFWGSYDWTSSVATHWMLAALRRAYPSIPEAAAIAARFDEGLSAEKVAVETAYFAKPFNESAGRLGGWAWVMMLDLELRHDGRADAYRWAGLLKPLTEELVRRTVAFLPKLGTPGQTAATPMALAMIAPFAHDRPDKTLLNLIRDNAWAWYGDDVVETPLLGGEDTAPLELAVAELMRRTAPERFEAWFARYLPGLARGEPQALLRPVDAGDRADMRLTLAIDTLNLSRAGLLRSLANGVDSQRAAILRNSADRHLAAALSHLDDNYLSQKGLPSWALLALQA